MSAIGFSEGRRTQSRSGPLRIGVLVSSTGANLRTLLELQEKEPEHFEVCLVASQGDTSPALDIAAHHGIEAWPGDFEAHCGRWSSVRDNNERSRYRAAARTWHDELNARMAKWEGGHGVIDLIVLAYHRWIEGDLLTRFSARMVNQHPGDLTVLDGAGNRILIGRDPVRKALSLGLNHTRTSSFLVNNSRDGGPILCQGPTVSTKGRSDTPEDALQQELRQKEQSDKSCLEWTVKSFASGRLGLSHRRHPDGSSVVTLDGQELPFGGMRL